MQNQNKSYSISLLERFSTDAEGIAKCLGLQGEANIGLDIILQILESKISSITLLKI